jgi:hypothetical protein
VTYRKNGTLCCAVYLIVLLLTLVPNLQGCRESGKETNNSLERINKKICLVLRKSVLCFNSGRVPLKLGYSTIVKNLKSIARNITWSPQGGTSLWKTVGTHSVQNVTDSNPLCWHPVSNKAIEHQECPL